MTIEKMITGFSQQYTKALNMLEDIVNKYSSGSWLDHTNYQNAACQIAYHALFYTNIYASPAEDRIIKWEKEIWNYHDLKKTDFNDHLLISDINALIAFVRNNIKLYLKDFSPASDCWPSWYSQNQFEFHINNLRHLQQHTAELIERLNNIQTISYHWQ